MSAKPAATQPWENDYNGSFNSSPRDELLNGEIFYSLAEAGGADRSLAAPLQYRPRSQQPRLSPASSGNGDIAMAGFRFPPPPSGHGEGNDHVLIIKLVHPMGGRSSSPGTLPPSPARLIMT